MEDKKNRPFLRAHNAQALAVGIIYIVWAIVLGWLLFPLCLNGIVFILLIYWGIKAYQGEMVNIPVITDFVKKQGWA
jgi:uncharacterized membrane protein